MAITSLVPVIPESIFTNKTSHTHDHFCILFTSHHFLFTHFLPFHFLFISSIFPIHFLFTPHQCFSFLRSLCVHPRLCNAGSSETLKDVLAAADTDRVHEWGLCFIVNKWEQCGWNEERLLMEHIFHFIIHEIVFEQVIILSFNLLDTNANLSHKTKLTTWRDFQHSYAHHILSSSFIYRRIDTSCSSFTNSSY